MLRTKNYTPELDKETASLPWPWRFHVSDGVSRFMPFQRTQQCKKHRIPLMHGRQHCPERLLDDEYERVQQILKEIASSVTLLVQETKFSEEWGAGKDSCAQILQMPLVLCQSVPLEQCLESAKYGENLIPAKSRRILDVSKLLHVPIHFPTAMTSDT